MHNFPTPYPDELLYSVFGRYHMAEGNLSPKQTTELLYSKRTIRSVVDLPCNLELLARRIDNPLITADYLIDQHTLFPFYGPFFLKEQYEAVRSFMKDEAGGRVHTTSGISPSNVIPKVYMMHCEQCRSEDFQAHGETYWHRVHQLPGVLICPRHGTVLYETSIPVKAENQHEFILATWENTVAPNYASLPDNVDYQQLLTIAHMAHELLNNRYLPNHNSHLQKLYKRKLSLMNCVSVGGYVDRKKLYGLFQTFYNRATLNCLQSTMQDVLSDWLTMIFQHHRKSFHPIRHMLVILFLGESLSSCFRKRHDYGPFGDGPWLCLNPACIHYKKSVVTDLKVTRCSDTKLPVGTFSCHCGFVYSRRGPDESENERFKIGRIKAFGSVWQAKLQELISEGGTLSGIAKTLNCDPMTVKRQATLLNIPFSWKGQTLESAKSASRFQTGNGVLTDQSALDANKRVWLEIRFSHPNQSKTELRRLRPAVYAFLYRVDKEWLDEHSPRRKHVYVNNRVNWEERDEVLLAIIKNAVEGWDIGETKPKQMTVTSIGKKINQLSLLEKKAARLPKTMAYLDSVKEDVEAFQLRRVKSVANEMKQNGEEIREWKLYRNAGLRPTVSNKVKQLITQISHESCGVS